MGITGVAAAISVGIELIRVEIVGAVVADIAEAVPIRVVLVGIVGGGAVVAGVTDNV